MTVDDFVVLGRTVPEESRKYGKRICMAGYSSENNQLLRVYPLMVPVGENADTNGFKARHMYSLQLRRNQSDSRTESWRLLDEKHPTATPWAKAIEQPKQRVVDWLAHRAAPSIKALNATRQSLGVIVVEPSEWYGFSRPKDDTSAGDYHTSLFDDLDDQPDIDVNAIRHAPYIRFTDAGGEHNLQVREWGAYRLLSRPEYIDKPEALWGAPGYRTGKSLLLVVGNMSNHRANWLVIKTFELEPRQAGVSLFDCLEQ